MSGLPVAASGFQQIFLRGGQIDRGAVAAAEAVELDGHFLALQIRREADEGDDDVGVFRGFDGLVAQSAGGRLPGEIDAGGAGAVEIFEPNAGAVSYRRSARGVERPRRVRR